MYVRVYVSVHIYIDTYMHTWMCLHICMCYVCMYDEYVYESYVCEWKDTVKQLCTGGSQAPHFTTTPFSSISIESSLSWFDSIRFSYKQKTKCISPFYQQRTEESRERRAASSHIIEYNWKECEIIMKREKRALIVLRPERTVWRRNIPPSP